MPAPKAHIIVIDGAHGTGKKTLCFELALALLYSAQQTAIALPPDSPLRQTLCKRQKTAPWLPQPSVIDNAAITGAAHNFDAILIPGITPEDELAASAGTYITLLKKGSGVARKFLQGKPYLNAMWELKKKIAARRGCSLNWIVCENNARPPIAETPSNVLEKSSRLYGFRTAAPFNRRLAYQNNVCGISAQDKSAPEFQKQLTYDDICARREIIKLAEFIFS